MITNRPAWANIRRSCAISTKDEFDDWLGNIPDQVKFEQASLKLHDGTHLEAVEIGAMHMVRPGDEAIGWRWVYEDLHAMIAEYIKDKAGPIFWRIKPEFEAIACPVWLEYREDGPDHNPATDQKGVADKNWLALKGYCRLARAPNKDLKNAA